jgi:predicted signal transduction protein with EAL and GGDEF domain
LLSRVEDTLANTENLAIVLAVQTSRSLQAVDIVPRDVRERIAGLDATTPAGFRRLLGSLEMYDFLRTRLDRLPQVSKIDQSFIRDLAQDEDAAAIVRAITSLGAARGMTTTAEGVETHDQFVRLRAEGCTEVQGYFFSRPHPASETRRLPLQFHGVEMHAA